MPPKTGDDLVEIFPGLTGDADHRKGLPLTCHASQKLAPAGRLRGLPPRPFRSLNPPPIPHIRLEGCRGELGCVSGCLQRESGLKDTAIRMKPLGKFCLRVGGCSTEEKPKNAVAIIATVVFTVGASLTEEQRSELDVQIVIGGRPQCRSHARE